MAPENDRQSIESPARSMVQEVLSRADLDLIDDLVAEDYVQYVAALSEPVRGREALKETVAMFREGTPDLTKTIEEAMRTVHGTSTNRSVLAAAVPAWLVFGLGFHAATAIGVLLQRWAII